jgi:C-terminal domain on Strawberry notch homologue
MVAEVTGRATRVIRKGSRLIVENRAASANLAETAAFMDDAKRILVFSDAGGTGRSYHAELSARNRRLRVHYLLEPGWKADAAIHGLGRTNRTNQAQPPLFRPIATDVKAEKRFLSTIARRLETLGAITRGQRQTGGQGLFRPEDNLESQYGREALRQLYQLLARGKIERCSLEAFEDAAGLKLTDTPPNGRPPARCHRSRSSRIGPSMPRQHPSSATTPCSNCCQSASCISRAREFRTTSLTRRGASASPFGNSALRER